jgi:hypothetical protein
LIDQEKWEKEVEQEKKEKAALKWAAEELTERFNEEDSNPEVEE